MNTKSLKSFRFKSLTNIIIVAFLTVFIYGQAKVPTPTPSPVGRPVDWFTVYDGTTLRKGEYTFSAAYSKVDVQTLRLTSKLMDREMPYRVVLPYQYAEHNQTRYPVIYLLHGLTGHYDNWTDKTNLIAYAATSKFIIVTPEGNDGWYTDSVSVSNDKFESYMIKELIPEIDKKFRTHPDRDHRAIAGLSMGGYGGLKFGLKYPDMFFLAGSFSGALGAASFTEKSAGAIGKTIDSIYGPMESETRKANDIFRMVKELPAEKAKILPFLYLACGTEDFLFQNNRDFDQLLIDKKVPHEFREAPGGHEWTFWDSQVREFLAVVDRRMGK